jgi:hypothetical protein
MVRFDPLRLPIQGDALLEPRSPLKVDKYSLKDHPVTGFEEDLRFVGLEFRVSEKYKAFQRVLLSRELDGLPVESRLQIGDLPRAEQSLVKTKWAKLGSHYVPSKINIVQTLGGRKPKRKATWDVTLTWTQRLGPELAEGALFDFDQGRLKVQAVALQDILLKDSKGRP